MSCCSCTGNAALDELPLRERIGVDEHWRVAHVFDTDLPGWLVLVPRRHVTAIAELTDAEAAALGTWQVRLSRALGEVTGCAKTYVAQFAEKDGFAHVHFHVIPRMPEQPSSDRGPGIFDAHLGLPPERWVPEPERDRIAAALAEHLR